MDPLSDVLSLLKPHIDGAGGFDLGAEWSVGFPEHSGIKCYAIVSGHCWLALDSEPEPLFLSQGDCVVLPRGRAFRLTSDLDMPPVPYSKLVFLNGIRTYNDGGDCFIVGGHFTLAEAHARILLRVLSPIVHIKEESDQAALRWSLERMRQELREQRPGASLIAQHLAHMVLVQALRMHVADGSRGGVGWLFALADKQISVSIAAMHDDPARRWTLDALAERAGMSRSAFALRFKTLVGETPIEYLARWRMLLASERLVNTRDPVSVIARSLGYESESAFSAAFRRINGCAPRRYSRGGNVAVSSGSGKEPISTRPLINSV